MAKKRKKRPKRGFPLASILTVTESQECILQFFRYYSQRLSLLHSIQMGRKFANADKKQKYQLFEQVVDIIRPQVREGLKAFIIIHPKESSFYNDLNVHMQKHHQWLIKAGQHQVTMKYFPEQIATIQDLKEVLEKPEFSEVLTSLLMEEAEDIQQLFEQIINDPRYEMLFTIQEGLDVLKLAGKKQKIIEYIYLSKKFYQSVRQKQLLHHFLQLATNTGSSIRIFEEDTPMSDRLHQFGGFVAIKHIQSF